MAVLSLAWQAMDFTESATLVSLFRNHARQGTVSPAMLAHLVLFQKVFHDELMTNCGRWLCVDGHMSSLHAFVEECRDAVLEAQYSLEQCLDMQAWADEQGLDIRVAFPEELQQSLIIGLGVWFGFTDKVVGYAQCEEVHVISDRD